MAHKKAGGSAKNLNDSNPKYLGIKVTMGDVVKVGSVIVRQRGTVYMPGKNVGLGKDHTIFALKEGKVQFKNKRKQNYDSSTSIRKLVSVI